MSSDSEKLQILIGVDGSQQAEYAFEWYAKNLHKPEKNLVTVVHTIEMHIPHSGPSVFVRQELIDAEWERSKEAQKDVEAKYLQLMKDHNITGKYEVLEGKPGEAIVKYAADNNGGTIVVGTRGMGTLRRTILGSVSDYIVHHAHCPVIVVRQ